MLSRLRRAARHSPRLALLLVLTAFSSQALATTLDWCLHGTDSVHVASGFVAPCSDTAAAVEADGHAQHATRIAADSDGVASLLTGTFATGFVPAWHYYPAAVATLDAPGRAAASRRRPGASSGASAWASPGAFSGAAGGAARPRVSGAVHGESAQLLI